MNAGVLAAQVYLELSELWKEPSTPVLVLLTALALLPFDAPGLTI